MDTHEKIRLMRELNKWSQEDMAEKLSMSAGGYAKIERGDVQLNIHRLQQIAAIFNVDMWDLLQSGKNGVVVQINEGDSGGDISLNATRESSADMQVLKLQLQHCRELLAQKDREIELLRKVVDLNAPQKVV